MLSALRCEYSCASWVKNRGSPYGENGTPLDAAVLFGNGAKPARVLVDGKVFVHAPCAVLCVHHAHLLALVVLIHQRLPPPSARDVVCLPVETSWRNCTFASGTSAAEAPVLLAREQHYVMARDLV